jgi:hypothetical protein
MAAPACPTVEAQSSANTPLMEPQLPAKETAQALEKPPDSEKPASWLHSWLFELASLVTSVLCLVTMLILLLVYRNKAVPELSLGLTFNAIISVLITAAKVAMLSAVASAMGQIKFKHFRGQKQPLINLELFDEASRGGPWGAIDFIFRLKWRSTAAVGAAVVLLALAMDPFAQQLLTYPVRVTFEEASTASLTYATAINPETPGYDNLIQRYVNDAIWNDPRPWGTSCSSGNCTFPTIESLSWCPRCEDITDTVRLEGCGMDFNFAANVTDPPPLSCNVSISSGVNISTTNVAVYGSGEGYGSHGNPNSVWTVNPGLTFVWDVHEDDPSVSPWTSHNLGKDPLLGDPFSMLSLGQVDLEYSKEYPFRKLTVKKATGCTMNPCLREYTIETVGGTTSVSSRKVSDGVVAIVNINDRNISPWLNTHTVIPAACWVSNYTMLSNTDATIDDPLLFPDEGHYYCGNGDIFSNCSIDSKYVMCESEALSQADVVRRVVSGNITTSYSLQTRLTPEIITSNTTSDDVSVNAAPPSFSSYTLEQMLRYRGLNATLQNMANSLTVMMQNVSNDSITGQVGHPRAYVHVRWPWLIFPAVVIFIGIIFVLCTIVEAENDGAPVWKNSSLALIYHGLPQVDENTRLDTLSMRSMEERARKTMVQLEKTSFQSN